MKVELTRTFYFEAAHYNPFGTPGQQRLHGHSYRVDLVLTGVVTSEYGWLMDYGEIKALFEPWYALLDHQVLNEVDGLSDSRLPQLRTWILERIQPAFSDLICDVHVSIVGACEFCPIELPEDRSKRLPRRWRFTFEAAQYLPQLPETHQCRRVHGHSYRIEAGAEDMEKLREGLSAIYDQLDHTCLNDIDGLQGTTCEHMAYWMWNQLEEAGHAMTVVVVQETESARCAYYGN